MYMQKILLIIIKFIYIANLFFYSNSYLYLIEIPTLFKNKLLIYLSSETNYEMKTIYDISVAKESAARLQKLFRF